MKPMPQDVKNRVRTILTVASLQTAGEYKSGVYIGFSSSRPGLYKIGQTRNMAKRVRQLRRLYDIKPINTHFISTVSRSTVEGLLHCIFADVRADCYNGEREWFELTRNDAIWLGRIKAIHPGVFEEVANELVDDLLRAGYSRAVVKAWFRFHGL